MLLVLDEIAALSRLESIAIGCNLLRGFGATMFMVAPSLSDKFTADYISAVAGVATEMIPSESAAHHPQADGRAFAPQAVPLYSPSEIGWGLPDNVALVLLKGLRGPVECHLPGYWRTAWAQGLQPNPYAAR